MNKFTAYFLFFIVIFFLVQTVYVVNLNSQLDRTMDELIIAKSEEHIFRDEGMIDENYIENSLEIEKSDEDKNVSEKRFNKRESIVIEDNLTESYQKVNIAYVNNIEVLSEAKLGFLVINPQIDIDELIKTFGEKKEVKKVEVRISTKEKKRIFLEAVLPAINESRNKLLATYKSIKNIKDSSSTLKDLNVLNQNQEYLSVLYKTYKIKNEDIDKLLLAVKPHPISIILAQATLESGWGTSRFYKEANNIFGMWSFSKSDERIKAKNRKGVYLKKYDSFVEAVDDYMVMLGRSSRYSEFRRVRHKTDNPYEIIKHLEIYSELREEYVNRLRIVIKANKFQKYGVEKEVKNIAE